MTRVPHQTIHKPDTVTDKWYVSVSNKVSWGRAALCIQKVFNAFIRILTFLLQNSVLFYRSKICFWKSWKNGHQYRIVKFHCGSNGRTLSLWKCFQNHSKAIHQKTTLFVALFREISEIRVTSFLEMLSSKRRKTSNMRIKCYAAVWFRYVLL